MTSTSNPLGGTDEVRGVQAERRLRIQGAPGDVDGLADRVVRGVEARARRSDRDVGALARVQTRDGHSVTDPIDPDARRRLCGPDVVPGIVVGRVVVGDRERESVVCALQPAECRSHRSLQRDGAHGLAARCVVGPAGGQLDLCRVLRIKTRHRQLEIPVCRASRRRRLRQGWLSGAGPRCSRAPLL